MKKKKKSKFWLFILVLLAVVVSPILIDQQRVLYAKNQEMQDLNHKITDETKHKSELEKKKAMLNTDEYAERVAREKLGMIKSDEKVFVDVNR